MGVTLLDGVAPCQIILIPNLQHPPVLKRRW
jgi:hypothetical protein